MTNRENFLSLLRRRGFERVPVEFSLCPHLVEVCKEKLGVDDYVEYFGMPWRNVEDLRLLDYDVEKYRGHAVYVNLVACRENVNLDFAADIVRRGIRKAEFFEHFAGLDACFLELPEFGFR